MSIDQNNISQDDFYIIHTSQISYQSISRIIPRLKPIVFIFACENVFESHG